MLGAMNRYEGKVALVTGGASGIGAATARRMAAEGARCVIADRHLGPAQTLADEIGGLAVQMDVTSEDAIAAGFAAGIARFGQIDAVFANAGIIGSVGPLVDTQVADWDLSISILLRGVFLTFKHGARSILATSGRGAMVATSSSAGVMGGLGPHAYTAAKHAVIGLAKSAAAELAGQGIRVNAVAPGSVVSGMTAGLMTGDPTDVEKTAAVMASTSPLKRAGTSEDIAAAVAFLCSEDAANVTGHCLVVDAGTTSAGRVASFSGMANTVMGA
jgi:NAD(P)-dependent dehydrogenase (short-subunit alcohol dehydrogenase family)